MSLSLVTAPSVEPLTVADLRDHLRISFDDEDQYVARLASVVRQRAERATRRALITQTWDLFLDSWPTWDGYHGGQRIEPAQTPLPPGGYVLLPKAPLQRVEFVKYVDLAGVTQTWDPGEYLVDAPAGDFAARGRLSLGWVKVWPVIRPTANAVQIRMVCGYGDSGADVPPLLLQAQLFDAGMLYETRSSILTGTRVAAIEIPSTTQDIYRSFRSL